MIIFLCVRGHIQTTIIITQVERIEVIIVHSGTTTNRETEREYTWKKNTQKTDQSISKEVGAVVLVFELSLHVQTGGQTSANNTSIH